MKYGALRIAVVYTVAGLLWITLSDKLLFGFQNILNPGIFLLLSSVKGFLFVLANGLLLFKIIQKDNKKILESEQEYREIYEGNPNSMWIYDIETLNIISVNDSAIEKYGYSREEFEQMNILDLRPVEDHEAVRRSVEEIKKNNNKNGIWRHIKKDGTIFYVNVTSHTITFNNRCCVMTNAQDITDKVLFEQQLEKINHDIREERRKLTETQQIARIAGWEYYIAEDRLEWSEDLYNITSIKPNPDKRPLDTFFEYIYPEDQEWARAEFGKLIYQGKPLDKIHRISLDSGEIRYIRQLARVEYVDDKPYRVIGSMQDVTELKQLELERNKYLINFDYTINTIDEMFFALNHNMELINMNDKFQKEYGVERNAIGKKLIDVFPGTANSIFHKTYERVLENREVIKLEALSALRNKWLRIAAYPTDEGAAIYLSDISDQKQKDLEIQRLAGIITRINNMVMVLNAQSQIEWVNKAFEEFTGYELKEIRGKYHGSFMRGPNTAVESIDYINQKQAARESFSVDILKYTKAGEEFWVNVEFTPTFNDDGIYTGYIGVYQNITQRKQSQQALLRQNDLLREVAWISSHEVRRPVASILGLINLLNMSETIEEKEEVIELIEACAKELDGIVHTISNKVYEDIKAN